MKGMKAQGKNTMKKPKESTHIHGVCLIHTGTETDKKNEIRISSRSY